MAKRKKNRRGNAVPSPYFLKGKSQVEEIKEVKAEDTAKEETPEEKKERMKKLQKQLKDNLEERRAKFREANEAMSEGKGRLRLEKPIMSGDEEITELAYDFNALTGMEYTDAMDSDSNAQQIYRITYRQGLALFATAAAKQSATLDRRDIMERIGVTDAVEGVQLATLFFSASTRAGQLRISKKS